MRYRLLTHEHSPCSGLTELDTTWSLDDAFEAHRVLDELDDLEARRAARLDRG